MHHSRSFANKQTSRPFCSSQGTNADLPRLNNHSRQDAFLYFDSAFEAHPSRFFRRRRSYDHFYRGHSGASLCQLGESSGLPLRRDLPTVSPDQCHQSLLLLHRLSSYSSSVYILLVINRQLRTGERADVDFRLLRLGPAHGRFHVTGPEQMPSYILSD
jgi:hypothetical protein